jgi:hypothetical protein
LAFGQVDSFGGCTGSVPIIGPVKVGEFAEE